MTILQIGALAAVAALLGRLHHGRALGTLGVSALTLFWLQPSEPASALRFWIPIATLGITISSWALTAQGEARGWRQNWSAIAVLVAVVVVVDANRFLKLAPAAVLDAARPQIVFVAVVAVAGLAAVCHEWRGANRALLRASILGIVVVFVVLKTPAIATSIVERASALSRQAGIAASGIPFSWLGFSYLAFRLLHTLRDRQSGRLPDVTLAEYVDYVIFFPAFTSGPIDRVERFVIDLRAPADLQDPDWIQAAIRLVVGAFKKFVLAELLVGISISDALVAHTKSTGWLWLFLYAYALRIYLDFSGYTDIAIGTARLLAVRLPENFAAPYLQPNIAKFWNTWHITLTLWFRAYVFSPLARALRRSFRRSPDWSVILVAQVFTMTLIGLWHGVAWGFAAWGLWHAAGLFVHNRWLEFTRPRLARLTSPTWTGALKVLGVAATFNFVSLGWLFFELSSPTVAWQTLLRMIGAS